MLMGLASRIFAAFVVEIAYSSSVCLVTLSNDLRMRLVRPA